ncbi:MAG: DUF308 domain-containing protein [Carnobacterium sp.]|uniref:HdeD family acid-resistance protein n=1 Tax=Carnobacterium sp. TaxID=48221 RepID=UPI002FC6B22B
MEHEQKFNWGYFVLGILFILVSLISFQNPASNLIAIVAVFGISAILKGIFEIVVRRKSHKNIGTKSTHLIVIGILDIVIGLFLLFNMTASLIALPYVFAFWFIFDSIGELMTSGAIKQLNFGLYWFTIIINILGIAVGFMLLFNPISSALTLAFLVGFYFMVSGILYIVAAF